jgi:hypothetical protein
MCEGCAPKKFYVRAFTQRIGAREWEMPPQGLRHKETKNRTAPVAGGESARVHGLRF